LLVRNLVQEHDGRPAKSLGDGLMANLLQSSIRRPEIGQVRTSDGRPRNRSNCTAER